jgi:hypothetical protein
MIGYKKWGLLVIVGSVTLISFYNISSCWVKRKSQQLIEDIIDNKVIQTKTTDVTNKMIQKLLTDENLLEMCDNTLQQRIKNIMNDEIILHAVISWIEKILIDPRIAEKLLIFLNNLMGDEKNKLILTNLFNNILSDPELIKISSKYLEAIMKNQEVLKAIEEGLTVSASNGLNTEQFVTSSSNSLKSIISKTIIPNQLYEYIKMRQ